MINKLLKHFDYIIVDLEPVPNVITPTNRYYSDTVLDKAIKEYIKEKVKKGRALGELHPLPNEDNPYAALEISLNNVSHIIIKIWKWKGRYKALIKLVTKHIKGMTLKMILEDYPNKVKFNLRGVGSVHTNETLAGHYSVVNDDLHIISWNASPI